MIIEDSIDINAPVQTVWEFLLNVEEMGTCLPGVESVEALDAMTYRGRLKVKIGPIAAGFNGQARLTELVPPERFTAEVQGDDRVSASAVRANFTATLEPIETGTRLHYRMDVTLRGRLAQFGTAVVNATAKKMTAEFAANLREKLET